MLFRDLGIQGRGISVRVHIRVARSRPRVGVVDILVNLNNTQPAPHFRYLALFDEELEDDAVEGGRDLDAGFVGLDFAEGVEGGDAGAWG